ncbi:MAG: DJ-1/PfpI family protein [Armatimonadota bacterium]
MASTSLTGKRILFLLADGFGNECFGGLRDCLFNRGARILIAGPNQGVTITGTNNEQAAVSDMSFAGAATAVFDAVILSDDATAQAAREHPAVTELLTNAWERGAALVVTGAGIAVLAQANILGNARVAADPAFRDQLLQAGAGVTDDPICIHENLITARSDADMAVLCNTVTDFLLRGTTSFENRWVA